MSLPNIWGAGSIFAFSGLDGVNTVENSLVGTLSGDKVGIVFHTNVKRELFFHFKDISDIKYEVVASDIIEVKFSDKNTGAPLSLAVVFISEDTVAGITCPSAGPVAICHKGNNRALVKGFSLQETDGEYTVLAEKHEGTQIKYAFAFSKVSAEDAVGKAEGALNTELQYFIDAKLDFFKSLPRNERLNELEKKTLNKCFSVLKSQVYTPEGQFTTRWTTPDRVPHKQLWLWDSIFHSMGNKYISSQLAYESIKAVLDTQSEDGFIPHMASPNRNSDLAQPPVIAWGLYDLYRYNQEERMLHDHYEQLKGYLLWNMENRDHNQNYLFEWKINANSVNNRCDESGMDNSPRFDHVKEMDAIDFSCYMANEARCMEKIAEILKLEDEIEFWRSIYCKIKQAINECLWDEEEKFYFDRMIEDGKFKKVKAVSSFLPLFAGVCDETKAKHLVRHLQDENSFGTAFPIPSVSREDPSFGSDMWRGPVWINYNYMIALGLQEYGYAEQAREIIRKTIEMISDWYKYDGVVYEFYDAMNRISPAKHNRKGENIQPYDLKIYMPSIRDYGWSCSLYPVLAYMNI